MRQLFSLSRNGDADPIHAIPQKAAWIPRSGHRLGLPSTVGGTGEDSVLAWSGRSPGILPETPGVGALFADEVGLLPRFSIVH